MATNLPAQVDKKKKTDRERKRKGESANSAGASHLAATGCCIQPVSYLLVRTNARASKGSKKGRLKSKDGDDEERRKFVLIAGKVVVRDSEVHKEQEGEGEPSARQ